ncbi:MAG: anaerobic sulfite reductase subunit AsrB [Lentisphaeria bacterium]|nr:anaerobic sulfite reductase subunit AsrB [Lentisphaeria bacterium]
MESNISRPRPARIIGVHPETAIDWTYRLEWDGDSPRPGQFFQVSVPHVGEAPISTSGWGDGWIELTIRKVGQVTGAIFELGAGDRLHLRGPYGNPFPLADFAGNHTFVAAGGTGLAPVRGLIQSLLATLGKAGGPSGLVILAGFKTPGDMLFAADLQAWSKQTSVLLTVDRAAPGWNGHEGVITTLIPGLEIADIARTRAVVVGPPMMLKYTVATFLDRGLAPEQIWVSHERRMSCGVGKCGHCKIMNSYVCIDGPVYRYADAQWLTD